MLEKLRYYRLSSNEKKAILEKLRIFFKEYDIELVIVFGSFVELYSFRDIDIAIYSKSLDLEDIFKLSTILELDIGYPIDIVPLDQIPPYFRLYILSKGVVLYEKRSGIYEYLLKKSLDELILTQKS